MLCSSSVFGCIVCTLRVVYFLPFLNFRFLENLILCFFSVYDAWLCVLYQCKKICNLKKYILTLPSIFLFFPFCISDLPKSPGVGQTGGCSGERRNRSGIGVSVALYHFSAYKCNVNASRCHFYSKLILIQHRNFPP